MASIGSKILKLIFPVECFGCELKGEYLCVQCLNKIPLAENTNCFFCKKKSLLGKTCEDCLPEKFVERIIFAGPYEDELVKNLIWQCKYNYVKEASNSLAEILYKYFEKTKLNLVLNLDQAVVTCIPSSPKKLKSRGYNQAEILAKRFAELVGLGTKQLLVKKIETESQQGSSRVDRLTQLSGAFHFDQEHNQVPRLVILVDDVATTGATLAEASKALKSAGVERIIGLVVAHEDMV